MQGGEGNNRNEHLRRYVTELEAVYQRRDMRGLYQHLKRSTGLNGRQAGGQQFVTDENGVLLLVQAGRYTVCMLFIVRRLQLCGRRTIPLFMCFIDLQKAYDSVDRELPWKVLVRAGIPAEMIAVIRKFHSRMRGPSPYERRGAIGLVPGHAGAATGVLDVATAV